MRKTLETEGARTEYVVYPIDEHTCGPLRVGGCMVGDVPRLAADRRRAAFSANAFCQVPITILNIAPGLSEHHASVGMVWRGLSPIVFTKMGTSQSEWTAFVISESGELSTRIIHYPSGDNVSRKNDLQRVKCKIS
jgi:hypothetical protein